MTTTRAHGTYGGAQQHAKRGEDLCDPCRAARNAYMRRYRHHNPGQQTYDRNQVAAYNRAQARLRENHRDEFDQLYAEEVQNGRAAS
jgi:hypothetical protein